ncbi:uncharacterized protein LOC130990924 [Salvia miltiorrhiza]|uniref:uncharacterized protein LOC130990924 n=1 Tax=Salvia miltiorrhiza TaxID=226208 RepID=UPI0025AB7761|nr:uncharacterized protein LOC130990924 [Salvia miltiorrhiza]
MTGGGGGQLEAAPDGGQKRYLLACSLRQRNEASSSRLVNPLWNWIWGLEVVPKVKLFLWKCLSGALPSSQTLVVRSIDIDPICRRCGAFEETVEHALRDCPWVSFFWESLVLRIQPLPPDGLISLEDWFERIRQNPQKEVHQSFASLLWSLWYARNLLVFQGKVLSHEECVGVAQRAIWTRRVCLGWAAAKPVTLLCNQVLQLKISCDAALDGVAGMGFGVAISNGDGEMEGCRYGYRQGVFSALEGEAIAVLEGLLLCKERGISSVILETDCQSLFWRLSKRDTDLSYVVDT